jgi:phage antirepressor YoqD-like protein
MSDIIVREVEFHNDKLLAVKDNKNDKIYVGISYICNGIGLTRKKADYEISRIQSDAVLQKGTRKIGVASKGGTQESICLELDYLPLWLAKINANIIKDEYARDKLIEYQLKAKDVLANAFIDKGKFEIPQTYSEALMLAADFQHQLEEQKPKVEIYDALMNTNELMNFKQVGDTFGCGRNTLMSLLRKESILSSNESNKNLPYSKYSKAGYFKVKITPRKTDEGIVEICTTLCTTKALKLIKKVLDKNRDLQMQAN